MLQAYVSNQGDGWDHTLGYLERFLRDFATTNGALPDPLAAHGGFLALMATLGRRTAELHKALAMRTGAAAFEPEPLLAEDIARYTAQARADVATTLSLLRDRLGQLPAPAQIDGQALLTMEDALQASIAARKPQTQGGIKSRYHGDFHLGQVLVRDNDFVIIDFEGEPARSFDERRAKGSPLRDVAGMLRSFNYARWSALRRVAQSVEEAAYLAPPAAAWEQATRQAFMDGYSQAAGDGNAQIDTELLALFELEKALYELRYELNNRADWAQVPLNGVLALLQAERPG